MPTFAGAGDALGMAMGGAINASRWMLAHSHNAIDDMLSALRPTLRPAEVATAPIRPGNQRSVEPLNTPPLTPFGTPLYGDVRWGGPDDHSRRDDNGPSVGGGLSPLSSGGGGTNLLSSDGPAVAADITTPVPELPPFILLMAGLAVLMPVIRRHGKSRAT